MKFRYYIVDFDNFSTEGTDEEEEAHHFAATLEYIVIDTETGHQLTECSSDPIDIQPL